MSAAIRLVLVLLVSITGTIPTIGATQSTVVVIPMFDDPISVSNIVTVAKSGGDFTDPIAALASIDDNDIGNRYVVFIGPGVYELDQTLTMKPFVNIVGSGRLATTLRGTVWNASIPGSATLIRGASFAVLANLDIENKPPKGSENTGVSLGIYNTSVRPILKNIGIIIGGAMMNYGIYNIESRMRMKGSNILVGSSGIDNAVNIGVLNTSLSDIEITDSSVEANFGNITTAIENNSSTITIDDVNIRAMGGSVSNTAVRNSDGSAYISESRLLAEDSSQA
ncbi:MAG: hypothetical protein AAF353_00685, partial [Pseudomonadota bacterium]